MKKTISITLNGIVFNIEEDAYERLNGYLEGLKRHFGQAEYGKEVVNDIESRIGEQLAAKVQDRKKEAVNLAEVDDVIKTMGTIEDLSGEGKKPGADSEPAKKRLYRNPDDKVVAGVAGGIASYFNIDPVIPRLVFALSVLAGGTGAVIYVIMWIAIPEAQTSAEKLEMKGNPVNVANLEENAKENMDRKKKFNAARYFFRELFYLIGRFFGTVIPAIGTIIGLIVTAVAFVSTFAVTLLAAVLLFNPDSPYIDPAIAEVFNGSRYALLIIAGYATVIIPVLVLLLLGIRLVRRRKVFSAAGATVLTILWFASASTFGAMAAKSAPQIEAAVKSIEERPTLSKEFTVPAFDSVETERDHRVKIVHGPTARVIAYGDEGQLEHVRMEVVDNALVISQANEDFRVCLFCIRRAVTVEITTPSLVGVDANSASRIEINGFTRVPRLNMEAHGASRILFDGSAQNIGLDLGSAARVELHGTADKMVAELTNASRLEAENFSVKSLEIDAMNSSRADVHATDSIKARASGASRINYGGDPEVKDVVEDNAARITPR
jgi:phage shock protein PspC (stress-responsive transcriptional regulator)